MYTIQYLYYGRIRYDEIQATSYSHADALAQKLYNRVLHIERIKK